MATRRRAGFTLIELLVAITVLAVVAVLGWRGLDGIVRARLALNEQLTQTRGLQLAFAQMESDCAHLAMPALIQNRPALVADDNLLLLVRSVYADDQPSRLQVVTYRVRDGVLTRQESLPTRTLAELDLLWQSALQGNDATPVVALQPGLAAMTIRFWAADRPGWRPTGSAAGGAAVTGTSAAAPRPTGLEVSLLPNAQQQAMVKVFLLGAV